VALAVSVIVPNLNGAALLPRCLAALARQSFREFEVIVVDNGSTDGSGRAAPPADLELRLIELESNSGFTGACNRGFRESRGRFIAILNNDAVPEPGWLAALVAAAESGAPVGMVASRVLALREPGTVDSLGLLPARNGLVYLRGMGEPDRPDAELPATEEVFGPSGVAALYRREMLDRIGFLAEPYFAYYEDADLAFRGRWAGWRCLLANQARVRHRHSATADAMDLPKTYYLHRNRLWTVWRDWPLAAFVRNFPWFFLYNFLTVWRAILFEGNLHAVKARMDAVMGLGQQLQWRRTQRRLRTVSGAEISRWLSREYPGLIETHRRKRAHETRA
jgi:GT2 family glycosyltransferase